MSERDELAKMLFVTDNRGAFDPEMEWRTAKPEYQDYAYKLADAILAAGYVKAEPAWEPTLENDGVYEYTSTGSCDGKESWHWKRKPRLTYDSGHFPWEKNDEPRA